MRDGGDVADDGEIEADGLQGTDGGFAAGAGAADEHFDFFQAVAHGLARAAGASACAGAAGVDSGGAAETAASTSSVFAFGAFVFAGFFSSESAMVKNF